MTCFKKLNKNTVAILNSSSNSWNSSQTIGFKVNERYKSVDFVLAHVEVYKIILAVYIATDRLSGIPVLECNNGNK